MDHSYEKSSSHLGSVDVTGSLTGHSSPVDTYEEIETYTEESDFSLEEFYAEQNKTAQEYLTIFEDTIKDTEAEKKRLEDMGKKLTNSATLINNAIRLNEDVIASAIGNFSYGISVEETLGITDEEWKKLDYEEKRQLVIEKTVSGKEAYENILRFQEELDSMTKELTNGEFSTYEEYEEAIETKEKDIATLKAYQYSLKQQAKEYPYLQLSATSDYLSYVENQKNNPTPLDQSQLILDEYSAQYVGNVNAVALARAVENGEALAYSSKAILGSIRYDLLTEEDKMMYSYLYDTKGAKEAYNYIKAIEDRLNNTAGKKEAEEFIKSISGADGKIDVSAWNGAKSAGKGFVDGIENWGEGMINIFKTEGMISTNQYAQMYILEALEESKVLTTTYQIGETSGNMAPSIATSLIVSAVASPLAGKVTGTALMGLSAAGNAKNQALINGNKMASSYVYGACIGLSEATLGYFLGKMPGLSETSGLTLKNLFMEGAEEFTQEWVDAGLQVAVLGADVDWSTIPKQATDSFLMGVLMAGVMNGGAAATELVINGVETKINANQVLDYIEEHPDSSIENAISMTSRLPFGSEDAFSVYDFYKMDSTATTVSIKLLNSLLNDSDMIAKFQNFNQNTNVFTETKDFYLQSLELYVASMQKDGKSITPSMESNLSKIFGNNWENVKSEIELLQYAEEDFNFSQKGVSITNLNSLLFSDESVRRFIDFSHNRYMFSKSQVFYVNAINEYVQMLQEKGCTLSYDMIARLNAINSVVKSDVPSIMSALGNPEYANTANFLQSTLANQDTFNQFMQEVYSLSPKEAYARADVFYRFYRDIQKSGLTLNTEMMSRLEDINALFRQKVNYRTDIFRKYSEYGANQNAVRRLAINPLANPKLYNKMIAKVQEYYPFLSAANAAKLLRGIDVTGVCSYATAINELLVYYDGREAQFKSDFGMDLYRVENGQKIVNTELILTDLYCFANQNNNNLISFENGKYKIEDDSKQFFMSGLYFRNTMLLNKWLQSKGVQAKWDSKIYYSNYDPIKTGEMDISSLQDKIIESLASGKTVALDAHTKNPKIFEFGFYPTNPKFSPQFSTGFGPDGGGHSVLVTGIAENGDLIVSSWGKEHTMKLSELKNGNISVHIGSLQ